MARTRSAFRQQDITRAVKAVLAAGERIARVEIDSTGKIIIVSSTAPVAEAQSDLDRELQEWEARNGQG